MQYRVIILLSLFLGITSSAFPQKEVRKQLKAGNKEYKLEKYTESEIAYRKALEVNAQSADAAYNLGNSLYKQGKFPEALQQYQAVVGNSAGMDTNKLSSSFHNMGNIFMNQQDYSKSVAAYRQSLRLNPHDDETRYNLALAQKLLQEQQQNQDQNKDKDKKDDKKDNKKEDQNKDQQDKKEQEKQDQQQDKKEDKTQQEQQQNEQMSKDNAQQILDALLQDEKDTQEKVKEAQMRQMNSRKTDKDW